MQQGSCLRLLLRAALDTPTVSEGWGGGFIQASGNRERPLRKLSCVTAHLEYFKCSHLNSWALMGNKPAAVVMKPTCMCETCTPDYAAL